MSTIGNYQYQYLSTLQLMTRLLSLESAMLDLLRCFTAYIGSTYLGSR